MGLMQRVRDIANPTSGPACKIGVVIAGLKPAQADEFRQVMADRADGKIAATWRDIAAAASAEYGLPEIAESSLSRHARKLCACERRATQ